MFVIADSRMRERETQKYKRPKVLESVLLYFPVQSFRLWKQVEIANGPNVQKSFFFFFFWNCSFILHSTFMQTFFSSSNSNQKRKSESRNYFCVVVSKSFIYSFCIYLFKIILIKLYLSNRTNV